MKSVKSRSCDEKDISILFSRRILVKKIFIYVCALKGQKGVGSLEAGVKVVSCEPHNMSAGN